MLFRGFFPGDLAALDEVFTLCSENAVNTLALRRVARPALSSHELAKDAYVLR